MYISHKNVYVCVYIQVFMYTRMCVSSPCTTPPWATEEVRHQCELVTYAGYAGLFCRINRSLLPYYIYGLDKRASHATPRPQPPKPETLIPTLPTKAQTPTPPGAEREVEGRQNGTVHKNSHAHKYLIQGRQFEKVCTFLNPRPSTLNPEF